MHNKYYVIGLILIVVVLMIIDYNDQINEGSEDRENIKEQFYYGRYNRYPYYSRYPFYSSWYDYPYYDYRPWYSSFYPMNWWY